MANHMDDFRTERVDAWADRCAQVDTIVHDADDIGGGLGVQADEMTNHGKRNIEPQRARGFNGEGLVIRDSRTGQRRHGGT